MASIKVFKPTENIKKIYAGGSVEIPKYMPSYYEWLSQNSEKISRYMQLSSSTQTLYTVPSDYILFITAISLGGANAGSNVEGIIKLYTGSGAGNTLLLAIKVARILTSVGGAPNNSTSINPIIPIKIESNENIYFLVDNNISGYVIFHGFLAKNTNL